jgi:hypothetical protein
MELFLLLGFIAFMALVAFGATQYLQQRRQGTIVAVSIPLRNLPRSSDRGTSATQQ